MLSVPLDRPLEVADGNRQVCRFELNCHTISPLLYIDTPVLPNTCSHHNPGRSIQPFAVRHRSASSVTLPLHSLLDAPSGGSQVIGQPPSCCWFAISSAR